MNVPHTLQFHPSESGTLTGNRSSAVMVDRGLTLRFREGTGLRSMLELSRDGVPLVFELSVAISDDDLSTPQASHARNCTGLMQVHISHAHCSRSEPADGACWEDAVDDEFEGFAGEGLSALAGRLRAVVSVAGVLVCELAGLIGKLATFDPVSTTFDNTGSSMGESDDACMLSSIAHFSCSSSLR